jgi:hypothetical protein
MNNQYGLPLGDSHPRAEVRRTCLRNSSAGQNIEVSLSDGSTHILNGLLSQANHKQAKGIGFLSVGLTLTPRATGRAGRSLCLFASPGCAAACFADYDRLAWPKNKRVAVARTRLLAYDPERFLALLMADLARHRTRAERLGVQLVCRLNVVSDVPFEREFPSLFASYPDVQFMDYTKDVRRLLNLERPTNYHLTFSRSECNESDCIRVLEAGHNVTVVFRKSPFPPTCWGYPVIDGDGSDLRFLDTSPCIVGLKAKGKGAREDRTGFVLDAASLPQPSIKYRPPSSLPDDRGSFALTLPAKREVTA